VQAWKISRFAEVNKEWWLLLSLFVIAALLNSFGSLNQMLLGLYVLPTLFSAYFFGQRHATLTALASVFLVVLGLLVHEYILSPQPNLALTDSAWYQVAMWAGILILCGYATGRLFREMHESYRGFLMLLRYFLVRDTSSHDQVRRVAQYAAAIAQESGMNRDEVEVVRSAALLRDLAELSISPDVLEKAARLTANVHLESGTAYSDEELIKLRKVLPVVIAQLRKEREKSPATKIIEVAEEFDSLVSGDRNKPIHPGVARGMLARAAGGRFDEKAVAAFEAAFDRGLLSHQEVSA
jgi:uncharacterized protein (UPF0147 family)